MRSADDRRGGDGRPFSPASDLPPLDRWRWGSAGTCAGSTRRSSVDPAKPAPADSASPRRPPSPPSSSSLFVGAAPMGTVGAESCRKSVAGDRPCAYVRLRPTGRWTPCCPICPIPPPASPRRSPLCTPPAAASASRVLKRVWPGSGRAKEISRARTCTHTHARPTVFPFWETTILAPPQCIYCTRPLLPLFPLFPPSPLPTLASLPQRPRDCGCACQPSRRFGLLATSTSTHPLSLDHSPSWSIVKRLHRASPPSQGGALAAERAAAST